MNSQPQFRDPTAYERSLLDHLLEADFPGKTELLPLLRQISVRVLDEDGGLEIKSEVPGTAPVVQRVPVEAEGKDEDGTTIHVLLHVVDGRPVELEIYSESITSVKRMPPVSEFEVFVLPPPPEKGWPFYK
jgi:hypothetical protein